MVRKAPTALPRCSLAAAVVLTAALAASAQSVPQLPPISLPPVPSAPGMLFAPADVPALRARRSRAPYDAWYNAFRSFVDTRLGRVSSALGDDTLGRFAKAAAALHALGESPPSGPFASYRDAAAEAIIAMADRSPNLLPGTGTLVPQYDSSTLQCMAEAYDLLRGSGLPAATDRAVRARIATWASAVASDLPLSVNPSNIMAKAGAALVSTALALPGEAGAAGWLRTGLDYLDRVLADKLSPEGWWREGPHYANYTLNNLVSTAWHVRNRTGVDWFPTLRPLVRYALDATAPDGLLAPYEEGIPVSFPFHTLLAAYPGDPLQPEMAWAWSRSAGRLGSYLNQQQHDVTAFVFFDDGVAPQPPASDTAASFVAGDENLVVLRSGRDRDAIHASVLTAVDYSLLDVLPSRHNTRNPLDLVLYAGGHTLLPTASGGPQITRSANRSVYLSPASRQTILVNGAAPFIAQASQVRLDALLDEEPDPDLATTWCDAGRTTVEGAYRSASRVSRTLALLGGSYLVVLDEIEAPAPVEVRTPWRGRGARKLGRESSGLIETRWNFQGRSLEVASACSDAPLTRRLVTGLYAPAWGQEESIAGIEIAARGAQLRLLHVLQPHTVNDAARTLTAHHVPGVAVLEARNDAGESDWIAAGAPGLGFSVGAFGGTGHLIALRTDAAGVRAVAIVDGTEVHFGNRTVLRLSERRTVACSSGSDRARLTFASDTPFTPVTVRVDGLADLDPARSYAAAFNGVRLDPNQIDRDGDAIVVRDVIGAGTLVIAPEASLGGATGTGSGTGSGTGASSSSGGGGSGGGCALACDGDPTASTLLPLLALGLLLLLSRGRRP